MYAGTAMQPDICVSRYSYRIISRGIMTDSERTNSRTERTMTGREEVIGEIFLCAAEQLFSDDRVLASIPDG